MFLLRNTLVVDKMNSIKGYINWCELLAPEKYILLSAEEKSNIESTKIIPCALGSNNFGFIEVTYRIPKYRPIFD